VQCEAEETAEHLAYNKTLAYFGGLSYEGHVASNRPLVGAFAKLRNATISFVKSFRPSVCLSLGPHGTTPLPLDGI